MKTKYKILIIVACIVIFGAYAIIISYAQGPDDIFNIAMIFYFPGIMMQLIVNEGNGIICVDACGPCSSWGPYHVLVNGTCVLPDQIPKSKSLEQYSSEIAQINEKSKKYHLIDDVQKFNASKKLMQKTLKEIISNYMGLEIGHVELLEGYYPFQNATFWEKRFDLEPLSVCDFEQKIPLHMTIISQTENFKMFTKKYAPYKLELSIQDERTHQSNVHYGLIATNDKNQRASTYFHINSCTGEITDKEPYFLHCFDEDSDYRFVTFNHDDIISSYSNDHFCKIELDPWRQSLYDYSKTIQQKQRQLERESMEGTIDPESQWRFFSEMNKQGDLGNLISYMIHYDFDEQSLQEKIEQYELQYGSLPEEFLELMEKRK